MHARKCFWLVVKTALTKKVLTVDCLYPAAHRTRLQIKFNKIRIRNLIRIFSISAFLDGRNK